MPGSPGFYKAWKQYRDLVEEMARRINEGWVESRKPKCPANDPAKLCALLTEWFDLQFYWAARVTEEVNKLMGPGSDPVPPPPPPPFD